jgi:type I restriction enzyme M protein
LLNDLQSAGNAGEYYTPRAVTAFMVDRIDPKPGEILFDPSAARAAFSPAPSATCASATSRKWKTKLPCKAACVRSRRSNCRTCSASPTCCCTASKTPASCATTTRWPGPTSATAKADRVDIILTNPPFGGREEDGIESNFPAHFRTKETADLFLALFIRLLKPAGRAAIVLARRQLFGEGVKTRLKEHLLEECNLHTIVRLPNSVFKPYASIGTNLLFFEKGEPTQDIWFYEHQVPAGQKAYSMTRPIKVEHLQGCVDWWGGAGRDFTRHIKRT